MYLLVHPVDGTADGWWRKYGFEPALTVEPMLMLPLTGLPFGLPNLG